MSPTQVTPTLGSAGPAAATEPGSPGPSPDQPGEPPVSFLHIMADKWQLPLLAVGLLLVMSGLPRLLLNARTRVEPAGFLALARQALIEDHPTAALHNINILPLTELDDATRSQAVLIRGLALCKLAEVSYGESQHNYAAGAIADLDEAERLAGSIAALDNRLTSPADFHFRRARLRQMVGQPPCQDLVAAIGHCDGQERMRRDAVEMLMRADGPAAATQIDTVLERDDLSPSDRLWMQSRKCRLLARRSKLPEAEKVITDLLDKLPPGEGQDGLEVQLAGVHLQASQSPDLAQSQRDRLLDRAYLLLSAVRQRRSPIAGQEEIDAELNWLLGEVCLIQDRPGEAFEAFARADRLYPSSEFGRACRLGLAKASVMYRPIERAFEAYEQVVNELLSEPVDPLVDRAAVEASLLALANQLRRQSQWQPAWQFLTLLYPMMQASQGQPSRADVREMQGDLLRRMAMEEKREADSLSRSAPATSQPDQVAGLVNQARQHLRMAAEAYLDSARMAEADDRRGGDNLERAADCYDEAGETAQAIVVLRKFIHDYPSDQGRVARAVFSLGKACQAAGQFEEAITLYLRMNSEYANSPDANKSRVPMAQCHKALGQLDQAERILTDVLADDQQFSPDSSEYRQALFELAKLKYERGQYRQAIPRFDEALQRDGQTPAAVYYRYFLADSYRLSGTELDSAIAAAKTPLEREQLVAARTQWLRLAREQFEQVIAQFEARPDADRLSELDSLYLRNCYFFRADCAFDLADYQRAVEDYDVAAVRYRGQAEAVAAYVQIVNCYLRMGRPDQARAANERAKWLLKKLPADQFTRRPVPLEKRYFADWLGWAGRAGIWPQNGVDHD